MELCLAGICNYSVWAECLAFRGHIPISPLQPPGEAQLPAPSTGKGWSQWTNMSVPVLFLFVFSSEFTTHQPQAESKLRLLGEANSSTHETSKILFTCNIFPQMLQKSWRAYVIFPFFDAMQTRCDVVYGAGKLPPVYVPFLKWSSRKATAILSERNLLNSFSMWASNVSSFTEGYYYTVSVLNKQRMWTCRYPFSEFVLEKWVWHRVGVG